MTAHLGDLVALLIDGRLGHDQRDRALAHVARCGACQREVAAHRSLKARLSALGGPDLPSTLVDRIVGLEARTSGAVDRIVGLEARTSGAFGHYGGPAGRGVFDGGFLPALEVRRPGFSFPVARLVPAPARPRARALPGAPAIALPGETPADAGRDWRRVGLRTVLGSAAVVVLTVGGGSALTAAGDPTGGTEPPRPATSVAAVPGAVPVISPSWPALSMVTLTRPAPPTAERSTTPVFGSVTVSFRH